MNFKSKKFIIILLSLLAALFLASNLLLKDKTKGSIEENYFTVKRGNIVVSVNVTGTIEPWEIVEVKSTASGKILKMPVEKGDFLKDGQLIAEVEKTYTQPNVDQAEAYLRSARAKLEQAKINIELQTKQNETEIALKQEALATAKKELETLQSKIENEKTTNLRDIENAKNNLNIAKLKLNKLKIGSRPEEIKRAEATLNQSKSNLELMQKQYERLNKLGEQGYVSKENLDNAKAKFEDAKAQNESAVQNLEIVKNSATKEDIQLAELEVKQAEYALEAANQKLKDEIIRENDLEVAKSSVKNAENSLSLAISNKSQIEIKKKDLDSNEAEVVRTKSALKEANDRNKDTLVTAPITGTILQKLVQEGNIISSGISSVNGGTTLLTMADLTRVYVKANVDETDIGKVLLNQRVKIVVDAFPKENFKGKVLLIAPQGAVVSNVTTFEVTIEIENPRSILRPGMNASLDIISEERKNVLFIPNDAIKEKGKNKLVFVMENGKQLPREITTGVNNYEYTEVISGINEGEVINKTLPKKDDKNTPRPMGLFGSSSSGGGGGRR